MSLSIISLARIRTYFRQRPLSIALVALACLVPALATAAALMARPAPAPLFPGLNSPPVAAYTIEQRQTIQPAGGGQSFLRAVKERQQRSDGTFAIQHTYYLPDGTVEAEETGVGHVAVGMFRFDRGRSVLEFLAGIGDEPASDGDVRSDPGFQREEALMGQRALVLHYAKADGATSYRETYRAPDLNYFELKSVSVTPRGEDRLEPTRIDLGEPAPELFSRLARYPKSFARYEESLREAERRGDTERAAAMRRRLARARN